MSYCLNPLCPQPQNLDDAEICHCGAKLRLQDRYMALQPIGQGGFGRTFLAIDLAHPLKLQCVIKQFFPQEQGAAHSSKASALFQEEAMRLQELGHHSQIPDLLAQLEQEGRQYLVQEFIDGFNLACELAEDGPFTEAKIHQLLIEVLPVLQFMHQHHIIHRDIKPANIIRRSADSHLVLVDLGAAKQATGTALAQTGTVIGSAEFTAPEQARGKAVFASDLYSLGVTCIHLLTQMSPFDLFDSGESRWVWQDYVHETVSDRLGQILDKMLEPATNRRYPFVASVLADLQAAESPSRAEFKPIRTERSPQSYKSAWPDVQRSPQSVAPLTQLPSPVTWDSNIPIGENNQPPSALSQAEDRGAIANSQQHNQTIQPTSVEVATDILKTGLRLGLIVSAGWAGLILLYLILTIKPQFFPSPKPVKLETIRGGLSSNIPVAFSDILAFSEKPVSPLHSSASTYTLNGDLDYGWLYISSDSQTLASVGFNNSSNLPQVEVWNLHTQKLLHLYQSNSDATFFLPLNWNDRLNGLIRQSHHQMSLINPTTGKPLRTLDDAQPGDHVQISQDGTILAIGHNESFNAEPLKVQIWNIKTGSLIHNFETQWASNGTPFTLSADGSKIALIRTINHDGGATKAWQIYDTSTGVLIQTLEELNYLARPYSLFNSSNTTFITRGSSPIQREGTTVTDPNEIQLWNVQTGKLIREVPLQIGTGFNKPDCPPVFSPNGEVLAIANT
ncbi:MAG TPA: serine/threonine-protein kinase, partial [Crinalium sp.]